jgi:hypothetical protein
MTSRRLCVTLALIAASGWLAGCSSSGSLSPSETLDGGGDGSIRGARGPDSGASFDAASVVSETVGAAGGTVAAAGVALIVPPGALAQDTTLTVYANAGAAPAGFQLLSARYAFGPASTTFATPATVQFALTGSGSRPTVYWSNPQGGYDGLPTAATSSTASAQVWYLSGGFVAEDLDGGPGGDAATVTDSASDSSTVGDGSPNGPPTVDAALDAEASAADATSSDAASDATVSDANGGADASAAADALPSDGGSIGIHVTIGGTPTSFAFNASASNNGNSVMTIKADDGPSTTHWTLQVMVFAATGATQCAPSVQPPWGITYTHYTGGAADAVYTSHATGGSCVIDVSSSAAASGQHETGTFSGALEPSSDAGSSVLLTGGSFDVVM